MIGPPLSRPLLVCCLGVVACSASEKSAPRFPVASVRVAPESVSVVMGLTTQLAATTLDARGRILQDRAVTWSATNTAVATVSASGLVTGVAIGGPVAIVASSEGQDGSASVIVVPPPVASVSVTPVSGSVTPGSTVQLVATLRDERSNVLTDRLVTWTSSNTALATVSASGLVTGVSPGGPLTITATSEAKSGTSSITVVPPVVTAITLSPAIAAVFVGAAADLTATVIDQNGVVLTDRVVTWTTSDVAVATVSPTGQVIGISVGTATITASSGGVVGRAMITVSVDPCVSNVTISPGQTLTGMLEATDCPLDDGSFVDLFKLTLPMNARVQIDLTSTAFDPYLLLFELLPDGSALAINADNDGGPGTDARIQQTLDSATTYLIGANSLLEGKTGPYQLSVQLVASGMAAARLRPEDALTAAAVARKVSSGRRRGGSR